MSRFEEIPERALTFEKASDGELKVNYLKDVSFLLSLNYAVRECNIEKHLLTERNMICLAFAYDHQNYACCNTYKNFYLYPLKQSGYPSFHDLKIREIGRSITGERFSEIDSNLFAEYFNKETKRTVDLFRFGFSTIQTLDAVNCCVNTIHIHTLLRKQLHKCLQVNTGSEHKELTPREIKTRVEHVKTSK